MKKILKNFIGSILLMLICLMPLNRAFAATTYQYTDYLVSLDDYITSLKDEKSSRVEYSLSPSINMHFNKNGGKYYQTIHEVSSDNKYYLGYCFHAGRSIVPYGGMNVHSGFNDLKTSSGSTLTATQQELLKNVVSSGYQKNIEESVSKNIVVGGKNHYNGTCKDSNICTQILATQILVWEIMEGARTNYDYAPNVYNASNSAYNALVTKNPNLLQKYKNIIDKAKQLTDAGTIPAAFGKTHILTWSDSKNQYSSKEINIGEYNTSNKNGLTVSNKSTSNNIIISSSKKIESPVKVEFQLIRGNTNQESREFRWFSFQKNESSTQSVLMGYYTREFKNSLNVQTEKGTFKLTKISSTTKKKIKGSKFELYKCDSNNQCKEGPIVIDLINNPTSGDITLYKSGKYLLKEVVTPSGYEKMSDIYISFAIDNEGHAKASFYEGDNGTKIINSINGDASDLSASNDEKAFDIKKIDGRTFEAVNGASFQIKNSQGNVMKFYEEDGKYLYSEIEGKIDTISSEGKSTYSIALLPAGEYTIVETNVPYPYVLSSKQIERETKIKIDKDYNLFVYNYETNKYDPSSTASVTIKNFKTRVVVKKTGKNGAVLQGAVFELYDSTKTKQISVKAMENGEYEYNSNQTNPIQLTTNNNGEIIINNLPDTTYYLKEVVAPAGYSIDKTSEWTQFVVEIKRASSPIVFVPISNEKGEFCFYKIDEDGNYLDDGVFKLQVYNETNAQFEDVSLIFNEQDNKYTIDKKFESDIYTFSPNSDGKTCFYDIDTKGRYRVVEIEAPEGFILPKASETNAEIIVNENGYATGTPVIINKKIVVGEGAEAQAELIINISTGQDRIHYIIIIGSLLAIITILFILKKKFDEK